MSSFRKESARARSSVSVIESPRKILQAVANAHDFVVKSGTQDASNMISAQNALFANKNGELCGREAFSDVDGVAFVHGVRWYPGSIADLEQRPWSGVPARNDCPGSSKRTDDLSATMKQLVQKESETRRSAVYKARARRLEPIPGRGAQRFMYGAGCDEQKTRADASPVSVSTEGSWTPAPWTICLVAVFEANIMFVEHADVALLASPLSLAGSMLVAVDRARRLECRVNTLPLTICELFCSAGEQLFTNTASNGYGEDQRTDAQKRASTVLVVETPFLGLALEFLTESEKNQFLTEFLQMKQVAVLQARILQSAVRFLETTWLQHRWRALYVSLWAQFGGADSNHNPSEIPARALTLEAATERIEALYRAVLAQHLRKRLAKACQVARQRGMNVRVEGRCCVGASLVTKAWISAGWAQIQWLRAASTPAPDEKGLPLEPIPGATNRIYVCSGEDLSKTLVVRWTVRSLRTGSVIDEFQLQTKPIFIDRQSLEAAVLQRWSRRPCCRVLCVRMQRSESDMGEASTLKESESYLLYLQSDEVAFYPSEIGDQRLPSAERSSRRPSLSSSTGLSAAASLLSIPYRVLYVSSDVCAPSSKPLLLIADTTRGISLVLAARSFAERNVAVCVLQHLSHASERPETGPAPPPGIARFAAQAAAAAERVTASRPDSAHPTNIVQRAETMSSEADQLSGLDLDVSVASRDSFSSSHDGEVRRDGRSIELARAGWHALGRGIAGLVQSSKSLASRPSFERWRGLSRGGRSGESSQRVRSAIEYLYLQYVRED